MSPFLIVITGLIYLYICLEQTFFKGNIGMGVMYFGYALGNVGVFLLERHNVH